MKFWIGFLAGAVVSGYTVTSMTAEQRRKASSLASSAASKVTSTQVGEAVADGASDIATVAGERASSVVKTGTDAVSDKIAPSSDTDTDALSTPPATSV